LFVNVGVVVPARAAKPGGWERRDCVRPCEWCAAEIGQGGEAERNGKAQVLREQAARGERVVAGGVRSVDRDPQLLAARGKLPARNVWLDARPESHCAEPRPWR